MAKKATRVIQQADSNEQTADNLMRLVTATGNYIINQNEREYRVEVSNFWSRYLTRNPSALLNTVQAKKSEATSQGIYFVNDMA